MKILMEFEKVYQKYVIFEEETNMFIGGNSMQYRVMFRRDAARFTKKEAEEYIENGSFIEKDKTYKIQDAI